MASSNHLKFSTMKDKVLEKCRKKEPFGDDDFVFMVDFLEEHLKDYCMENQDSDSKDMFPKVDRKMGARYDLVDLKSDVKIETESGKPLDTPGTSGCSDVCKKKGSDNMSFEKAANERKNKGRKLRRRKCKNTSKKSETKIQDDDEKSSAALIASGTAAAIRPDPKVVIVRFQKSMEDGTVKYEHGR